MVRKRFPGVTIAKTGQEGLSFASQDEYDIILMDINLGEDSKFNGYETARRIKKIKPHAIILSFSSSPIEEKRSLGAAMDGHLEKDVLSLKKSLEPYLDGPNRKKKARVERQGE